MNLTLVNWCSNDACDPCHCKWFTLPVSGAGLPWIFSSGTTLASSNFCGDLVLAVGANCLNTTGHALGDIVTGTIDIFLRGSWAQYSAIVPTAIPGYAIAPPVLIKVEGVVILSIIPSIDPLNILTFSAGESLDSPRFGVGGIPMHFGEWSAESRTPVGNCILRNLTMTSLWNSPGNCVLPLVGVERPTSTADVTAKTPVWDDTPTSGEDFAELYTEFGDFTWHDLGTQLTYNDNDAHVEVSQFWIFKHY